MSCFDQNLRSPATVRPATGRRRLAAALALAVTAIIASVAGADGNPPPAWRAIWSVSPSNALESTSLAPFEVIRHIVHLSAGGSTLRLRLSHRFGSTPANLRAVSIGQRASGAAIVPGTLRAVTFNGARAVRIPAGGSVSSDPIDMNVSAFSDLVISFAGQGLSLEITEHAVAREYSYLAFNAAAVDDVADTRYQRSRVGNLNAYFLIDGIDVLQTTATRTLVALGASGTDGYVSADGTPLLQDMTGIGKNQRYPDFLAQRLALRYPGRYTVANAGISGNRINSGPLLPTYGPALLDRLDNDVFGVPGVTDVLLATGGNDLGFGTLQGNPDAPGVIAGLTEATTRLKAAGLRVLLGTLTPMRGAFAGPLGAAGVPGGFGALHGSAAVEAARQQVNAWIRTQSIADGVVDFDVCLRDPEYPDHLNRAYDSGDHLHPNATGYSVSADCVNLDLLQ